MDVKD